MADVALQRKNMVESQVRPSDITDRRITLAMMRVPREKFVPEPFAPLAYMDETLAIGGGHGLFAPRILARLVQLASIEQTDKVLVLGGCSGYAAAIVASLCSSVTLLETELETDPNSAKRLNPIFAELGIANVTVCRGPLEAGWKDGAPYNVIFIEGVIDALPEAMSDQLAGRGRLVAVMPENGVPRAVLFLKANTTLTRRMGFEASGPVLPSFAQKKAFVF